VQTWVKQALARCETGGLAAAAGSFWPRPPWGLGPGIQHYLPPFMFAPPAAGPAACAHGGAAGGLAWADPDADIAAAILSTRAGGPWFSDTMAAISAAILDHTRDAPPHHRGAPVKLVLQVPQ